MHPRALFLLVLLVAAVTPRAASMDSEEGARYVLGYHTDLPFLPSLPGARVIATLPDLRTLVLEVHDAPRFFAAVTRDPAIRYVAPDAPDAARVAWVPNDPLLPQMHGIARIGVQDAWDVARGSAAVTVCIVDTGARASHEDLAGARMLGGIDIANVDLDASDDHGHGTHVTGTIAATTHNAAGIAGIAQVSFRAAKVLDARGAGSWSEVALGILWCSQMGSHVISLSLAGPTTSPVLEAAVAYAADHGALLVAASGNLARCDDCVMYPAKLPQVLAIGCWAPEEAPCAAGSAAGPELFLTAPGEAIVAPSHLDDHAYAVHTGTSMAAAHVSGVAALLKSIAPALTSSELRALLACSAEDVGPPGTDRVTGHGLVDARAALEAARAGSCG